ncbi:hypothetical protein QMK19_23360 [Streptomyces sp. H10-C2]|uniref:hypothetical protein n=1 Tax=unclassified Streptomyces TaxID=2593676 RepID=UPI0024B957DB|nr:MULTISPECIES: hypothetical protein [unclassified Streptomyces]MDJ0342845.1 hypothetical protein [Streptomyces sp. PH10-H1]MDJ0372523.1 hypothetical protein [Streptomyces sp. H10-C2]
MLVRDARDAYYTSSGTSSAAVRQLGLAGIAVVWILAGGLQKSGINLTKMLLTAGMLIVIGLFLDFAQYLWTTARLAMWVRRSEKRLRAIVADPTANVDNAEIGNAPKSVLPFMWGFFFSKAAAIAAAYILLLIQLWDRLIIS